MMLKQQQCCQDQEEKNMIFKKLRMRKFFIACLLLSIPAFMSAQQNKIYTIATLDPGHFHAALVQKNNVSKCRQ